jgi:hypothetical protein
MMDTKNGGVGEKLKIVNVNTEMVGVVWLVFGLLFHGVFDCVFKIEESGDGDSSVDIEIASQKCCRTEMHGRLCRYLIVPLIPIPMIRMLIV